MDAWKGWRFKNNSNPQWGFHKQANLTSELNNCKTVRMNAKKRKGGYKRSGPQWVHPNYTETLLFEQQGVLDTIAGCLKIWITKFDSQMQKIYHRLFIILTKIRNSRSKVVDVNNKKTIPPRIFSQTNEPLTDQTNHTVVPQQKL